MSQPLIEEAHVKFAGSSSELFELEEVDTEVVFTVKGTIKGDSREKQVHGVRRTMTVSITKVIQGVSKKILETDEEPSLFDEASADESDEDARPELPGDDDEGASVSSIGTGFSGGPQFSAGDGE
ncbi:hypothetical protein GS966_20140 [Rhodococcus hoagii]|nr:hypothetical protein [Prescottella equi]NKS74227.1 hypothetical protein [Prescottella equi]NKZ92238.1 hypothetical protein [Prescottella equi]